MAHRIMRFVPRTLRCPNCGANLDPTEPECPMCGELVRADPDEIMQDILERHGRKRFPVPWGLLILLGLYFGGVYAFLHFQYYESPEYQSAKHLRIAEQLLGEDEGETAKVPDLLQAFDHLTTAVNLQPENRWGHQRIELVVRLLRERNTKLPTDKQRLLDALSLRYAHFAQGRDTALLVEVHQIWDLDEISAMPAKVARWSVVGGAFILLAWLYKTWQDRRYLSRLSTERMEGRREELADLGQHRQRRRRD